MYDQHHQQIELNTNDPVQSTHLITLREVDIQLTNRKTIPTETTPTNDNNQVFSQPIVDHNWESRYYSGHLVATCGNFVAYSLKRQNGDDIVCVFYKQVDFRSVINPPFSGDIHDLVFSFSEDVLLACVDQASHLRIYRIEKNDEPNELQHTLILFVDLQYSNNQCPPTLSWCYFIPDSNDSEDNDAYTMLSVTRGSNVEVLNVDIASQSCISENMLNLNQIVNGRLTYEDNNGKVRHFNNLVPEGWIRIRDTTQSILRDETTVIFRELLATQKNDINNLLRQSLTSQLTMSRTTTPVPTTSVIVASPTITSTNSTLDVKQQHVLKLARFGQLNQAFEFALSASDLNLVLYLCENVRPAELFSIQPCPLQTPVLLSLIQQLAADLNTQQELKYSYIREALICLDLSHPSVRDYLQTVLIDLSKKLSKYIQANPSTPMAKRFQLLLMASQGLVQKIVQQRATPIIQTSSSK
ncbi:unnamed protein product [Rotaria sp. Silwood1]|nr:unnamed protein product [Rotaria sp. Silwood1]